MSAQASTSDVAETLNSGVVRRPKTIHSPDRTKVQVQEPWTRDPLKDILRRGRVYLGFVVEKRGLDERPGHHEPIIDEATYNAALSAHAIGSGLEIWLHAQRRPIEAELCVFGWRRVHSFRRSRTV